MTATTSQVPEWQTPEYARKSIKNTRSAAKFQVMTGYFITILCGIALTAELKQQDAMGVVGGALLGLLLLTMGLDDFARVRHATLLLHLGHPVYTTAPIEWRVRQWWTARKAAWKQNMRDNDAMLGSDKGVSPVIAVILLVAITVVLAATVYVWVSNFSTGGNIQPFPQITARDAMEELTSATTDDLVTLSHRGGDSIALSRYVVSIDGNSTDLELVTTSGATPTQFTVGDTLVLREDGANVSAGTHEVRIIDREAQVVVWEHDLYIE